MAAWTAQRYIGRAHMLHESGLVHIIKYAGVYGPWKGAVFCCFYRSKVTVPFGYRVEPDVPYYFTLSNAKQAGERWVRERGGK